MKRALLPLISLFLLPTTSLGAGAWLESLPEAREAAAAQQKDILVLYRGDEYRDENESPAALFNSPHFLEAAQAKYILVEQQAPLLPRLDGEDYLMDTAVLFCDPQGRPYYSFGNEWETGMDWLMVEFRLAEERKAAVLPLWQQLEAAPADAAHAAALLKALPTDAALADARCRRLRLDAEARGDRSHEQRVKQRDAAAALCMELFGEMDLRGLLAEGDDERSRRLRAHPIAHQFCRLMGEMMYLIKHSEGRDFEEVMAEAQLAMERVIAIEPRSKCARYCREIGAEWLRMVPLMDALDDDKLDPDAPFASLDALAPGCHSFHTRQVEAALRARLHLELGEFDAALACLRRAIELDPLTSNGRSSTKLYRCVLGRRALLEALHGQRLLGVTEAREAWRELLGSSLGGKFTLNIIDCDTFYADEAAVEEARRKVAAPTDPLPDASLLPPAQVDRASLVEDAESGDARSQAWLGMTYLSGIGVEKDEARAAGYFRRAAEQGFDQAQNMLGACYAHGMGVEQDGAQAYTWFLKAAEQGYAQAQYNCALACFLGKGVEADPAQGVAWLRKAAEQGHRNSQYRLGLCCFEGQGTAEDKGKARDWFRKAAEQGCADSQLNLGIIYADGHVGEKDLLQAEYWLRRAAEQGEAQAQYNLAVIILKQQPIDEEALLHWAKKSAEQGHMQAQRLLGYYYFNSIEGIEREVEELQGEYWLRKAAAQGDAEAREYLDLISELNKD